MFHLFIAMIMLAAGTALFVFAFLGSMFTWLSSGVAVLLYTKSIRSFFLFLGSRSSDHQGRMLSAQDWRLLMSGYILSAILFLTSGLAGEGWIGYLAAPVMLFVAFTFWFAAKRVR